jgi:hypothetical protein
MPTEDFTVVTVIVFLIVMAVIGTVGYLALRPLILEHWDRWQTERREAEERGWRQRHQKILQDQATTRVLEQIRQQEDQAKLSKNRRRAA